MLNQNVIDPPAKNQLAVVVQQNGLEPSGAQALIEAFQPIFEEAESAVRDGLAIEVTDATQVSEIKKARAARFKLRDLRVDTEHKRKQFKEESLRKSKAIDGIANVIKYLIEPVEQKLLEQEQFAERAEARRKASLKLVRDELVRQFGVDPAPYQLGEMSETAFNQIADSFRVANDARIAAEKKAAEERAAAEQARIEEDRRIRAENERLRLEAEKAEKAAKLERERNAAAAKAAEDKARKERAAIEAKAKAERDAADLKARREREELEEKSRKEKAAADELLRKERLAREAAEAKIKSEKEATARKAAAEAKAKKAASLAPDKDKLTALSANIRAIELPNMASDEGKTAIDLIAAQIDSLADLIEQESRSLA